MTSDMPSGALVVSGDADGPAGMTAGELLRRYRERSLSPVEAVEAVLARVERVDPVLNAFCLVDGERALAAARESERRWRHGRPCGRLDGVPVSVKDVLLMRGRPTLRGSRAVQAHLDWNEDAPSVARLRAEGAVPVGKTTTPEFGWKGVTDSPLTGVTRNPRDPSLTPGGSSGGAAAAVVAGMGPLALGTDGGGSVRIPAAFTGAFAFKPTYGLIPHYPASPFGTLAHIGPITRTVADAALLMTVVTGFDPRDWSAGPTPPAGMFADPAPADLAGTRIAYSPDLGYAEVDPEVAALVEAAVGVLAELGADVERADPGFGDPVADFETLWFAGCAKVTETFTRDQRAEMDPGLREAADVGARLSAVEYLAAEARRRELGRVMGEFHQRYHLLVTPTLPIVAFEAGREVPAGGAGERWTSWTPFTHPFNMTQQPAASLPCGRTRAGLPVGIQIVGPRHGDRRVLNACRALEHAL